MKALSSYFTPESGDSKDEEGKGVEGSKPMRGRARTRSSESEKAHPLQSMPPRGRAPAPNSTSPTSTPPPAVPDQSPAPSIHESTLSVPSTHSRRPQKGQDGASLRPPTRNSSRAPSTSRGSSIFPAGDQRNDDVGAISELKNDMIVNWLYDQQLRKQYASGLDPFEGVVLKKSRGNFTCYPPYMAAIPESLYAMISQMNVRCAMTVNTPVVRALLESLAAKSDLDFVPLPNGLRVQILRSMVDLPRGQLHHFAAFIEDARLLVVWDDDPEKLLARAQDLEEKFIQIIWGNGNAADDEETADEKKAVPPLDHADPAELEKATVTERRPVRLESSIMVAMTMILGISCIGLGWRALAYQVTVDGSYLRLALIVVGPIQFFLSLVRTPIRHVLMRKPLTVGLCNSSSSRLSLAAFSRCSVPFHPWCRTTSTLAANLPDGCTTIWATCHTSPSRCLCTRRV